MTTLDAGLEHPVSEEDTISSAMAAVGLALPAVRDLVSATLDEFCSDGSMDSEDANAWPLLMPALVVRGLAAGGLARAGDDRRVGATIEYLRAELAALKDDGWDVWDTSQVLLALHEVGVTDIGQRFVDRIEKDWSTLYEDLGHEVDVQWRGPAYLAAMLEVLFKYRRSSDALAAILERLLAEEQHGMYPSAGKDVHITRWHSALVLRALAVLAHEWPDAATAARRTVAALLDESKKGSDWKGWNKDGGEASMYLARYLQGLSCARGVPTCEDLRLEVDKTIELGNRRLSVLIAAKVQGPSGKSRTVVIEYLGLLGVPVSGVALALLPLRRQPAPVTRDLCAVIVFAATAAALALIYSVMTGVIPRITLDRLSGLSVDDVDAYREGIMGSYLIAAGVLLAAHFGLAFGAAFYGKPRHDKVSYYAALCSIIVAFFAAAGSWLWWQLADEEPKPGEHGLEPMRFVASAAMFAAFSGSAAAYRTWEFANKRWAQPAGAAPTAARTSQLAIGIALSTCALWGIVPLALYDGFRWGVDLKDGTYLGMAVLTLGIVFVAFLVGFTRTITDERFDAQRSGQFAHVTIIVVWLVNGGLLHVVHVMSFDLPRCLISGILTGAAVNHEVFKFVKAVDDTRSPRSSARKKRRRAKPRPTDAVGAIGS